MADDTQPHCCLTRTAPKLERSFTPRDEAARSISSTLDRDWTPPGSDCVMQAGSRIVFNSDGTGNFTSRVKTNHTHSGDKWHLHFIVKNKPGALLFVIPPGGQWEGPRMDDDHGWYDWVVPNFAWNQTFFDAIGNIEWWGSC